MYPPVQISQLPSLDHMMVEYVFTVDDGKYHWDFVTLKPKPKYGEFQRQEWVKKNGKTVTRFVLNQGPYMQGCRVNIDPGYPVVAIRAAFGLGSHWDTVLFALRNGKMLKMGRPPAMNSRGPALWQGHKDLWVFDNFDRYEARDPKRYRSGYVIMKVDRDFVLKRYKFIPDPHPKVPRTILTPDLE